MIIALQSYNHLLEWRDTCRFEFVDRCRWICFIKAAINFYPLFQKMLRSCCLFTLFGCIVGPPVPSTSPGQGYPGYLGNNYNGWTPWQNYFNYYLQRYFQSKSQKIYSNSVLFLIANESFSSLQLLCRCLGLHWLGFMFRTELVGWLGCFYVQFIK